jgi:hypothetical protein
MLRILGKNLIKSRGREREGGDVGSNANMSHIRVAPGYISNGICGCKKPIMRSRKAQGGVEATNPVRQLVRHPELF